MAVRVQFQNFSGPFEAARISISCQVVQPGELSHLLNTHFHHLTGDLRQTSRPAWTPNLIADDAHRLLSARPFQYFRNETFAPGPIKPAGAQDQEVTADLLNGLVACQFAFAVNAERIGMIPFGIG